MPSLSKAWERRMVKMLVFFVLAIMLVFILTPLLWALSMSFKREGDVFNLPIQYIPNPATADNYITAWIRNDFQLYFKNTLIVAGCATAVTVILTLMSGYALSRFKFKGKSAYMIALLCTQMLPGIFTLIPIFIIFRLLGLTNSLTGVVIANIGGGIPFNTLLMFGFINGIPKEIDEAALVDGATRWKVIFHIILPLVLPGIVATASFSFIQCWNEFFTSFALISLREKFTISLSLKLLLAESSVQLASLAAQCIIALVPPLLFFAFAQKYLVSGLAAGSVKG